MGLARMPPDVRSVAMLRTGGRRGNQSQSVWQFELGRRVSSGLIGNDKRVDAGRGGAGGFRPDVLHGPGYGIRNDKCAKALLPIRPLSAHFLGKAQNWIHAKPKKPGVAAGFFTSISAAHTE
jgi:hypothetical protein